MTSALAEYITRDGRGVIPLGSEIALHGRSAMSVDHERGQSGLDEQ